MVLRNNLFKIFIFCFGAWMTVVIDLWLIFFKFVYSFFVISVVIIIVILMIVSLLWKRRHMIEYIDYSCQGTS